VADDIDIMARFLSGDNSMLKCTICEAAAGSCDCWVKCRIPGCAWSFRKGQKCANPSHRKKL